ncbi:MAG TPA: hypothetical protein VLI91_02960 [Roseiarcus sp.]|nr:hypothetical protein [Roseiarcus sp.]
MFNEGYAATAGDDLVRPSLCLEAPRLCAITRHCPRRGATFCFEPADRPRRAPSSRLRRNLPAMHGKGLFFSPAQRLALDGVDLRLGNAAPSRAALSAARSSLLENLRRSHSASVVERVGSVKVKQSFLHSFRPLDSGDKCKAPSERPPPIRLRMLEGGTFGSNRAPPLGLLRQRAARRPHAASDSRSCRVRITLRKPERIRPRSWRPSNNSPSARRNLSSAPIGRRRTISKPSRLCSARS